VYRSGFESVCDFLANLQNSMGEAAQWVVSLLLLGAAGLLIISTIP
jgi:hypothetical protein